jgi:hypothetical protein
MIHILAAIGVTAAQGNELTDTRICVEPNRETMHQPVQQPGAHALNPAPVRAPPFLQGASLLPWMMGG